MKKLLKLATAAFMSFGTAAFAAETWHCEVPTEKPTSFVGGPLAFSISDDGKTAVVNNPMIVGYIKTPVVVDLKKNTEKVFRASWIIKDIEDSKGTMIPTLRYSAVIQKPSGRLSYYMYPIAYDNKFGATGKCVRVKQ